MIFPATSCYNCKKMCFEKLCPGRNNVKKNFFSTKVKFKVTKLLTLVYMI